MKILTPYIRVRRRRRNKVNQTDVCTTWRVTEISWSSCSSKNNKKNRGLQGRSLSQEIEEMQKVWPKSPVLNQLHHNILHHYRHLELSDHNCATQKVAIKVC